MDITKQVLAFFTMILTVAGTKAPLIWPDLMEINKRLLHILSVLTGGAANFGAGPPTSKEGDTLAQTAAKFGINQDEANHFAQAVERLGQEVSP